MKQREPGSCQLLPLAEASAGFMGVGGKWAPGARPAVLQVHAGPGARRAPGRLCEVRPGLGFLGVPIGEWPSSFFGREKEGMI